jgi:hypothetical protein
MVGLVLVVGTLVALNWDTVSKALDAQTERTEATLFRLGELMSIKAELKTEYGTEPNVTYNTGDGDRILRITFSDYHLPEEPTAADHAREIAAFATAKTKKFEQIDTVEVLFQISVKKGGIETTSNSGSYRFALDELMPAQPQAEPSKPSEPARE